MALVRTRQLPVVEAVAEPAGGIGLRRPLPLPRTRREPVPTPAAPASAEALEVAGRLRRCTFRMLEARSAGPSRSRTSRVAVAYAATCLYDRDDPRVLGDLAGAQSVCAACTASGIFRPDED